VNLVHAGHKPVDPYNFQSRIIIVNRQRAKQLAFTSFRSSWAGPRGPGGAVVQLPAVEVSQSPESKFREYLASRPRPQRYTEQQRDMVRFIFAQHNHFDADRLIEEMKKAGFQLSRATVYRTLAKLVDAGLLRRLELGPRMFYEHDYGYPQHEHAYCQKCGRVIEFQDADLDRIIRSVCQEHNFQTSGHTFVIRGICTDCNRARVTKRRLDLV
jgi:Fur family transcriptional regulator, ferric uptake regulator